MIVNPLNKIDSHSRTGTGSCPPNAPNNCQSNEGAEIYVFPTIGTSSCPANAPNNCQGDGIFISLDQVRSTTEDASPACVAMYGPDIKTSALGTANTCDLLFQDHLTDTLLGKWSDLKCNQRTHSLLCNLGRY